MSFPVTIEFVVNFQIRSADILASSATPSAVVGLPGSTTDGTSYTVISGSWFCSDVGDETQDFTLTHGYFHASTAAWTVVDTIHAETNLSGNNGANTAGQGSIADTTAMTLSDSQEQCIGINFPNATGTGFLSATSDFLSVTLKVRRTNGLR